MSTIAPSEGGTEIDGNEGVLSTLPFPDLGLHYQTLFKIIPTIYLLRILNPLLVMQSTYSKQH